MNTNNLIKGIGCGLLALGSAASAVYLTKVYLDLDKQEPYVYNKQDMANNLIIGGCIGLTVVNSTRMLKISVEAFKNLK